MFAILVGGFLLSVVHASIPNHWLPLVAISRSEKWQRGETIVATAITGTAHIISTIIIGFAVGLLGLKLAESYELVATLVAPVILILLGVILLIIGLRSGHHHHHDFQENIKKAKSKTAIITTLAVAMFFSPCIELEAYYFSVGSHGWVGIISLSIIYLVVTVGGMILIVDLARQGATKINIHWLEHHERTIAGIVLILTGVASLFIRHLH